MIRDRMGTDHPAYVKTVEREVLLGWIQIVPPQWLHEHLHDLGLRVIEVDVSAVAYGQDSFDGAVPWGGPGRP